MWIGRYLPKVTNARNTRKPKRTREQCETRYKKKTQSIRVQKHTRKEWGSKPLMGAKRFQNQDVQVGHRLSLKAKVQKDVNTKRAD